MLEKLKAILNKKMNSPDVRMKALIIHFFNTIPIPKSFVLNVQVSEEELVEVVDLLLKMKEPGKNLCASYLHQCEKNLSRELDVLKDGVYQDLIEFVDSASTGFLSDLGKAVDLYGNMFLRDNLRYVNKNIFYMKHGG